MIWAIGAIVRAALRPCQQNWLEMNSRLASSSPTQPSFIRMARLTTPTLPHVAHTLEKPCTVSKKWKKQKRPTLMNEADESDIPCEYPRKVFLYDRERQDK